MGLDKRGVRGETVRERLDLKVSVFLLLDVRGEREILNENTNKRRTIPII